MTMHVAQSGIFALGTGSHSYLEFDLQESGDPLTLVQLIASLGEPRMTTGGVNLVVGFKPSLSTPALSIQFAWPQASTTRRQ
jgi:porphyrinogen peroxidase